MGVGDVSTVSVWPLAFSDYLAIAHFFPRPCRAARVHDGTKIYVRLASVGHERFERERAIPISMCVWV